jgi:uncharacterized protein YyaL (SSP411 family)
VHGLTTVAVVGTAEGAAALLDQTRGIYVPSGIIAASPAGANDDLVLFADRDSRGSAAAAYVCRGQVCDAPVITPDALAAQLSAGA